MTVRLYATTRKHGLSYIFITHGQKSHHQNWPHEKENKFMEKSFIRFHSLFRLLNGVDYYMGSDAEPPFPPGLSQLNNILMKSF